MSAPERARRLEADEEARLNLLTAAIENAADLADHALACPATPQVTRLLEKVGQIEIQADLLRKLMETRR